MIREVNKQDKHIEYAIVDIETTGGNASGSRMTEIAVRIHDGNKVIDRYETLINPEKEIPVPIFALTGIDNEMVRNAPVFGDIAEKVFTMLDGRVFVAHNVNFDCSFIRHQLSECGFKWTPKKLCTVRMARKIKPGLRSYSLGNLCDALNIPMQNRHRAGGDCDATAILFGRLLEWDTGNIIPDMLKKASKDQRLPPNLPQEQFDSLPEKPGVYYFRDKGGKVLYVGKALNIKKRVGQHFTGHNINPQRQHFLRYIFSVSYEVCATELMALLLECCEIKKLWPPYNRALKRFEPKFGLFSYEGQNGYRYLAVGKLAKHQACIQVFNREYDGIALLRGLVHRFGLDNRLCRYGQPVYAGNEEAGSLPLPERKEHNALVDEALAYLELQRPTFAILDKGKDSTERSCIWVEKGVFHAMGYVAAETDLHSPSEIRGSLTRYYGNHYMMQLIESFAEKYPHKVWRMEENELKTEEYYNDLQYDEIP